MTNLFLKLVFIFISSVLNGANFESAENGISVHQYSVVKNDLQNSQGTLDKIEDVNSNQDSGDTSKELLVEKPGNVASLHQQSDLETSYESHNKYLDAKSTIGKRDKKSVKKSVKNNVKSTNNVEDEYPETMQDDDQAANDELEKEYVNQIKEKNGREFEEDDDDEDNNEETDNESEESSQNTNDEDNNEDENPDGQLSDNSRVSGGVSSGKRRIDNANWLVLQPLNDSLTVVGHKRLVKSDDRDKRRNKKGVRHELDEDKYKLKDLTDMNTMKKKLSEDDMYKRILLNLDNDSEEEKELKKWQKYKDNNNKINSGGSKRRKQKKKGKYVYLNDKDLNHGVKHGLISDGDSIYGRTFGKAKLKSPYFVDYTEVRHGKGNQEHVNYNAKKKHKKPLRKFKDNFQDIINNKLSKCKDSSSGDSKKQNSLWSVENKGDENTANKKKAHGNSINNKHGKMKHFLESDSKFQSDNNVVQNSNNDRRNSPVQVYRVDVEKRKIIPVFDGDTSSDKRREAHNSGEDNNYIDTPYNISIEFLTNPTAKDMRKRSLKYYNEEFPHLPAPSMYEKFHGNNVNNVRMFRNDLPSQDKNSILREKIISDIYNALKAKNPELIDTVQEVKNSELFNTDNVDLNDFLGTGNDAESLYDSRRGKDMYNGRNVHHVLNEDGLTVSGDNQYTENNNDGRENDVKRNANSKHLLNELTKMIQKKAAKIVTSTSTEVYSTRTHKTSTDSTESTTCMEFFKEFTGESNNMVANDEKLSTDDQWVTIPSVCMTSKAGKGKSGKSKTTQAVKQSTTITGTSRQPTTTQKIDQGKFADMLNGKLADRFFEEISKKVNRSKKMSREIGLCNEKYKPDATRRCIENGPEELLPLSTLKNIMYKIKDNKPESLFLCNEVPPELNSFINFLIANTKQKAKECAAVNKQSNFLFKASNANKYDSSLNKENDFNLIPEKQLNLQKSKLNRKTGKSDDYETEEKENVDEVLVNKVLGNKSSKMKSTTKGKVESEFVDDILKDDSNRLVRSNVERTKPADSVLHNDYDYNNINQYNSHSENYGNRELERFYYGNSDTNSETKSGFTTFKDKISDENENNNFNDDNDNHERTDSHNNNNSNNGGGPLKNLLSSSIFNTISDKIFKNKQEEDVSQYAKAKRQRVSDNMKIKMHKLLYEDGVPEDDEYYDDDDDDARVKKDTENSNTYEEDDDYDYDGYDLPFSDENKIADDSNLEDAFVVRTPVEEYNSYYE